MPFPKKFQFAFLSLICISFFSFKNIHTEKPAEYFVKESPHVSVLDMTNDILYYVNLHRKSIGRKALELNNVESSLAVQHSINMASYKTPFGHDGLNDRAKIISKKIGRISVAAENVASGDMTAKEVVDGWLNSPGHKRNIEGDFTLTGIGVAKNNKGIIYYTQIFTK
jgi:uncharacterized protein YkwD